MIAAMSAPDPYQPVPEVRITHPEWSKSAAIYQINTRQFAPEVTLRAAEAMKYQVRETDVDGYRCDVAGFMATDFRNDVRKELDAIKPVFMLAE